MDNLTHGLIGYTIYKLSATSPVESKQTERRLTWATILASELPDADMVSVFCGNGASLLWHRTYTHSLPGIILLAIGLTFILARLWPELPRWRLFGLTFIAGIMHSFFDLLTSYGTKFLLPWWNIPYAFDILPIVDPYLLLLLGIFLWAGYKNSRKLVLWSLVALTAGYIGWRVHVHDTVLAQVKASIPVAEKTVVMPVIGSIDKWRFAVLLRDGYSVGYAEHGGIVASDLFIPDISAHPAVVAAAETRTMAVFYNFARLIAYRLEREGALFHLTILDPRYAMRERTMFTGHVWLDANFNVVREEISH